MLLALCTMRFDMLDRANFFMDNSLADLFLNPYERKLNTLFNIQEKFIVEGARIRLDTPCLN